MHEVNSKYPRFYLKKKLISYCVANSMIEIPDSGVRRVVRVSCPEPSLILRRVPRLYSCSRI
jgi:hypothetical protein